VGNTALAAGGVEGEAWGVDEGESLEWEAGEEDEEESLEGVEVVSLFNKACVNTLRVSPCRVRIVWSCPIIESSLRDSAVLPGVSHIFVDPIFFVLQV